MKDVEFYFIVAGSICMIIALASLLGTMLGLISAEVSSMLLLGFGVLGAIILLIGYVYQQILDRRHQRSCRRP